MWAITMGFYDIDFNRFGWLYLPVRRRTARLYAWVKVMLTGLVYNYGLFTAYRRNNLYVLGHNAQKCFMTAVLNDAFDYTSRRITISDPLYIDFDWLFLDSEGHMSWIATDAEAGLYFFAPRWLALDAAVWTDDGVLFYVNVPAAVAGSGGYNENRLKALVMYYVLPGRSNFEIVY